MTKLPGTWVRTTPAGATPGSVNQASLEDALDRARHDVRTGPEKRNKSNTNYGVRSLGMDAETSIDSRPCQHTHSDQWCKLPARDRLHTATSGTRSPLSF